MVGVIVEEEGETLARHRLLQATVLSANAATIPPPSPLVAVMSGELVCYDELCSCLLIELW